VETRSAIQRRAGGLQLTLEQGVLHVEEGPDAGREYPLVDRPVVIGRGRTADLRLEDGSVSREHASLRPEGTRWRLADLGSRSGVEVDGVPVQVAELRPGARVRLGDTVLVFRTHQRTIDSAPAEADRFPGILGRSPAMRELLGLIERVAGLDLPVLISGETGTGKERLARAVHDSGSTPEAPYVVVDCTLLTDPQASRSELFGHVEGAYSGAAGSREGAFVRANGGTLVLDEVGELARDVQAQLLRVLQEGEVRPLGGDEARRVRLRVISATHRDIPGMVKADQFRADLYYRLAAIELEVPPLRRRGEDVALLVDHFLPADATLTPEARAALVAHDWPGNVRELEATVQRAAVMAMDGPIEPGHLGIESAPASKEDWKQRARDVEGQAVLEALAACNGDREAAAKRLGISASTLYRRLRRIRAREE
jgi:DNA-binding NtrC family response regulator